jgi:hypothetical protein
VSPVVVTGYEFVPAGFALFLPRAVLRDKAPQGREVDDDTVVEVGVPEWRDAGDFPTERAQLFDEDFLFGDFLALTGGRASACALYKARELSLLVLELGCRVVVENLVEGVFSRSKSLFSTAG